MLEFDDISPALGAKIKVIGVGGGGGNAVNTMITEGLEGVEFIAANTDVQALERNPAATKIQLGSNLTKGLGAGANPEIGRNAALEDQTRIAEVLAGSDMVFVTAGMGGGTGTGAAPVIANVARELGALTVGVVTKPFAFEGTRRRRSGDEGIKMLTQCVDTLITIPNQRLLAIAGDHMSIVDAFRKADEVLLHAVQGISDLITIGGYVNVDFADVKTIMSNMGMALMGTGQAGGPARASEAAEMAISSPLLEDVSINGATGILLNVTGGPDLSLHEINEASTLIQEAAHENANIIFGAVIDESMRDEIKITVIATGFDRGHAEDGLQSHSGMQAVPPQQMPYAVQGQIPNHPGYAYGNQNQHQYPPAHTMAPQGRPPQQQGYPMAPSGQHGVPAQRPHWGHVPQQQHPQQQHPQQQMHPQQHPHQMPPQHQHQPMPHHGAPQPPQGYAPMPPQAPYPGYHPAAPEAQRTTAQYHVPAYVSDSGSFPAQASAQPQGATGHSSGHFPAVQSSSSLPALPRAQQQAPPTPPNAAVPPSQSAQRARGNDEGSRRATFTPSQTNAEAPRRRSGAGLSPTEEDELAIPTFLRTGRNYNNKN